MKKNNEGYALVLVLLVLIVLGMLTAFMLTFSGEQVQTQRRYTARMQNQYAAAGEIEVYMAQLEALVGEAAAAGEGLIFTDAVTSPEEATLTLTAEAESVQIQCVLSLQGDAIGPKTVGTVTLTAISGTVQVQRTLAFEGVTIIKENNRPYEITAFGSLVSTAYQVSTVTGGGETDA